MGDTAAAAIVDDVVAGGGLALPSGGGWGGRAASRRGALARRVAGLPARRWWGAASTRRAVPPCGRPRPAGAVQPGGGGRWAGDASQRRRRGAVKRCAHPPPPGTRHRARRFLLWPWHFFCSPGRGSCQSRTTCRRRPSPPVLYVRDRAQRGDRRWWSPWSMVLFLQRCVTAARGDRASPEPAADVSAACPQHPSLEAVAAATVAVVTAAGGASARAEEGRPGEELLRPTRWQCPLRPSTLPPTLPYDQTGWAVGVSSQRAIVPP